MPKKNNNKPKTKKKVIPKSTSLVTVTEKKLKPKKKTTTSTKNKGKRKEKTNAQKIRNYRIKNIVLISLMIMGIAVISSIIAFFLYIIFTTEEFDKSKLYNKEASVLYDINGNEIARLGRENRELVTYDELPQVLVDAIVATEDSRFFQHNGLDIARFAKATLGQLAGQAGAGGGSTLTMQVSKQLLTSREATGIKGIIRKFRDIYISVFQIEKNYTKEEIIEFYVNTPGLGYNTFGVEQASQTYFGKSVRDLTLAEASLLAGIFNAPSAYNPYNSIELATKRRSIVLNLMVRHGYITEEEREDAESIPVESLLNPDLSTGSNEYQAFVDTVINEVIDRTGLDPANVTMQIYTTMDPEVQDILNDLNDGTLGYKWIDDLIQIGVAVTSTKDGSIVAVNGGRNYNGQRLFNRATSDDMLAHPGSTAKPIFDYGPFIEYNNGSPATYFFDEEMRYSNGQKLKNSDGTYLGMISMRTALYRSRNIPAVQAFQQVDKDKIAQFVHNLGIEYGDTLYESMAIGGFDGINPLEISAAYAAFGRQGYYIEPYSFTKIIYTETNEVEEFKYEPQKAMSEETAYLITDMLITATKNGVGGNLKVSGTEIGSKTGTSTYSSEAIKKAGVKSSASKDNWTAYYSPDYSIAIWYGYDKLMTKHYTTALSGASEKKKISTLLGNKIFKKNSKFKKPSNIISVDYELETIPLQSPSEFTPEDLIGSEKFKKGTEPAEVSNRFARLENPTNGKATSTDTTVVLSWDPIATPDAINQSYLETYFNENYSDWASKYLEKRITYNNTNIGNIGYQIYQEIDGNLTSLGYTTNTSYSTTCIGECKFIIKSAYSIFKNNMSTGLEINVVAKTEPVIPSEPTTPYEPNTENKLSVELNDICLTKSDTLKYNDEEYTKNGSPIKVLYDGKDVTSEAKITRNKNEIDRTNNIVETIAYTITYKDISTTATRKVTIADTCE